MTQPKSWNMTNKFFKTIKLWIIIMAKYGKISLRIIYYKYIKLWIKITKNMKYIYLYIYIYNLNCGDWRAWQIKKYLNIKNK